jgi:hypothetical protein
MGSYSPHRTLSVHLPLFPHHIPSAATAAFATTATATAAFAFIASVAAVADTSAAVVPE